VNASFAQQTLVLAPPRPAAASRVRRAFARCNAQEPALRIQPRNTKGSTENVPMLEAHQLDIALVAG